MENQDKKRELIIEAAIKRFAHFGLAKTTMSEIASDISFSKALLYYYFPDKISLYASVIEFIVMQVEEEVKSKLQDNQSVYDSLILILDTRHSYLMRYYNMLEFSKITGPEIPEVMSNVFNRAKNFELNTFQQILDMGVKRGELKTKDTALAAQLLNLACSGMKSSILQNEFAPLFFPNKEQMDHVLTLQKKLVEIFLNGLKC